MREIIALLFLICFSVVTFYLRSVKTIDNTCAIIFLFFTTCTSFLIVNYDVVSRLKWGDREIEIAERKINEVKQAAVEELQLKAELQKKSLGEIADTFMELAYVLSDGASRYGGVPEPHQKHIDELKRKLSPYLDSTLDKRIEKTLKTLDDETTVWSQSQHEDSSEHTTE